MSSDIPSKKNMVYSFYYPLCFIYQLFSHVIISPLFPIYVTFPQFITYFPNFSLIFLFCHLFSCFVTYFPNCSLIFLFCHLFSQLFTYFPVLSLIFPIVHLFSCFVINFPVLSFIVHFFSCFVIYFPVLSLISLSKHRKINQYPFSLLV